MRLFTYAVIYSPKKEDKDGGPKLLVEPTHILAKNEQAANMVAIRAIPEEYADRLERIEVALRPF